METKRRRIKRLKELEERKSFRIKIEIHTHRTRLESFKPKRFRVESTNHKEFESNSESALFRTFDRLALIRLSHHHIPSLSVAFAIIVIVIVFVIQFQHCWILQIPMDAATVRRGRDGQLFSSNSTHNSPMKLFVVHSKPVERRGFLPFAILESKPAGLGYLTGGHRAVIKSGRKEELVVHGDH